MESCEPLTTLLLDYIPDLDLEMVVAMYYPLLFKWFKPMYVNP